MTDAIDQLATVSVTAATLLLAMLVSINGIRWYHRWLERRQADQIQHYTQTLRQAGQSHFVSLYDTQRGVARLRCNCGWGKIVPAKPGVVTDHTLQHYHEATVNISKARHPSSRSKANGQ